MDCERRSAPLEIRAAGRKLTGYASIFNVPTEIGGKAGFVETVAPGAFKRSLDGDVLALVDHSPEKVLARTRSGTLRLAEDSRGLHFDLDLPSTSYASDLLALAERGDVGGASIGFVVPAGGDTWTGKRRTLRSVNLLEVSVVTTWPAHPETTVHVRSALGRPPSRVVLAQRYLQTLEFKR